MDLNLAGRSAALWGMCRSPNAKTNTILFFFSFCFLLFFFPSWLQNPKVHFRFPPKPKTPTKHKTHSQNTKTLQTLTHTQEEHSNRHTFPVCRNSEKLNHSSKHKITLKLASGLNIFEDFFLIFKYYLMTKLTLGLSIQQGLQFFMLFFLLLM
jgi:hypothetical protein